MDLLKEAPAWLLRPLPANAARDKELEERIDTLGAGERLSVQKWMPGAPLASRSAHCIVA